MNISFEWFTATSDSSIFGVCVFRSFASLKDKILGYQQAEMIFPYFPAGSPKALNALKLPLTIRRCKGLRHNGLVFPKRKNTH